MIYGVTMERKILRLMRIGCNSMRFMLLWLYRFHIMCYKEAYLYALWTLWTFALLASHIKSSGILSSNPTYRRGFSSFFNQLSFGWSQSSFKGSKGFFYSLWTLRTDKKHKANFPILLSQTFEVVTLRKI